MTNFLLGDADASLHLRPGGTQLSFAGHSTGAFKPDAGRWRWPTSLSGPLDEAPVSEMLPATSITSSGGILNASVDPRGLDATVVFDYGINADINGDPIYDTTTDAISLAAAYGGQPVSLALGGLAADTSYYVRCRATNANGTTPSDFIILHTLTGGPPPSGPPIIVDLPNVIGTPTETSITLECAFDMNGAAGLIHLEQFVGAAWVDIAPPAVAPFGIVGMTASAVGLTAGTVYQFRSRATNPNAVDPGGTIGGPIQASTAVHPPTLPVPHLTGLGPVGTAGAVVNGTISSIAEVPVKWRIDYGLTTAYGSSLSLHTDTSIPVGGSESVSDQINGLASSTTYHYRLTALRSDNQGGDQHSEDGTFTTQSDIIPVPTPGAVTAITSTTAQLNGTVAHVSNQSNVGAQWEYGTTTSYGTPLAVQTLTTSLPDATLSVPGGALGGLAPSTTYHYRLNAARTDLIGGTIQSADATFTTLAAPAIVLPVPTTLDATSVGTTTATLNGTITMIPA